ncbi:DUF4402 domain-containing protein [Erythrobacter litoralis]|uniref:DUF4402 domain-containing protein n=1 Tax=Erythrobacter litoralis (strain HTCC2594) TaxID=314225 RepID=Q2N875_ERYLH|nr:DUF4402 domain-containing protein [Erythrobacter litoralis]ABC64116.1 hypothetical protein ELI_10120 [Erythrobacter litoralis HTCC2594]
MPFKTFLLPLSALTVLVAMAPAAQAAPGDTHSIGGTAQVRIVGPTQIAPLQDLRFGSMMQPVADGTVIVAPDGTVSGTADTTTFPGNRGPAHFLVRGENRRFFLTRLPDTATIGNGTSTMLVDDFTGNFRNGRMARFDNNGDYNLYIGATLNMTANQEPGYYSGTFEISIVYQ